MMREYHPVRDFVRESNRIEGIRRQPTTREVRAHEEFLRLGCINIADMEALVEALARKPLRRKPGMNVRVGNHVAPPGGPAIEAALQIILNRAHAYSDDAYRIHHAYETLHPFMDGNGRSGRALWLWMMLESGSDQHALHRGFLHTWYYQSLSDRNRSGAAAEGATVCEPEALGVNRADASTANQTPGQRSENKDFREQREAIARIIDPEAVDGHVSPRLGNLRRQLAALAKADQILALITPQPRPEGESGWRMVPVEPDAETLLVIGDAFLDYIRNRHLHHSKAATKLYAAMLSASPLPDPRVGGGGSERCNGTIRDAGPSASPDAGD